MHTLLLLLSLALAIVNAETVQSNCRTECIYAFTNPFYPSFTMPPAQPNSPGDVQLNRNNPIRFANGSNLATGQGCNSGTFSYYEASAEQFFSTYVDLNEQISSIANVMYATNHDQLYVRTIQVNQANLASFLAGKILKINLTCNNGLVGCAYYTVESTPSSTLPTSVTCESTGSKSVMTVMSK